METTASSNSLKLKAPSLPRWYLAERDVCRVVKSASLAGVSSEGVLGYGCFVCSVPLLVYSVLELSIVSLTDVCFD